MNGNIRMLKINTPIINKMASDIAYQVQQKLYDAENTMISFPVGIITGSKFLAGMGPKIKIKVLPAGNVETEFKSEFRAEGINQTIHRLYLEVVCRLDILTPYDKIGAEIENQVLMCESVVVGEIPGTYYEFSNASGKEALEIVE